MEITAGSTDAPISIYCRALNGEPLTGKVAADFALTYRRDEENVELSLVDLDSLDAAHFDGGIYEVGNGEYRLDLPDEAVAAGANQVSITGTVDGGVVLGYPIALAENVWTSATRTLTTPVVKQTAGSAVSGNTITIRRGDTFSITLTGLGSIVGRQKLWFTYKSNTKIPDSSSYVQIEENLGLLFLAREEVLNDRRDNGSIVVDDEDAGDVTITVIPAESALLPSEKSGVWDMQVLRANGNVDTLVEGFGKTQIDVTRATE